MFKLSASQEWLLKCSMGNNYVNNIVSVFRIIGNINKAQLTIAVNKLGKIIPELNINIINKNGSYYNVYRQLEHSVIYKELGEQKIEQYVHSIQHTPIDLATDHFFKIHLVTDKCDQFLIIRTQHLIVEPQSTNIIFSILHNLIVNESQDNVYKFDFAKFIEKEQSIRTSSDYNNLLQLYKDKYKDIFIYQLELGTTASINLNISDKIIEHLFILCKQYNSSLFVIFYAKLILACNAILNFKCCFGFNKSLKILDLKLQSSVAPLTEQEIILLSKYDSFYDLINQINKSLIAALNGSTPKIIDLNNTIKANFNVLLDYQEYSTQTVNLGCAQLKEQLMLAPNKIRRDISLKLIKHDNKYKLNLRYKAHKISEETALNLLNHMLKISNEETLKCTA